MSYRILNLVDGQLAILANCDKPQVLVPQGQRLRSLTVMVSNVAYNDAFGINRVKLLFGGADKDGVPAGQNIIWQPPQKPDGSPGEETAGVWIVGDAAMANIKGFVFYVEFSPEGS